MNINASEIAARITNAAFCDDCIVRMDAGGQDG